MSNPSFKPDMYKIGYTTLALDKRIKALYKTGVPTEFVLEYAKKVRHCRRAEKEIHDTLCEKRVNPSREFFRCPLKSIRKVFEEVEGVWWKEGEDIKVQTRTRRFRKVKKYKFNYNYWGVKKN